MRKDKKRLDDELRTAVIENRNSDDGKTTMNDLFKCMKEFIEKATGNERVQPSTENENGAKRKYACKEFDFVGPNKEEG